MPCVIVISRGERTVNGTETSPVARDKLLLFHSTALHAIYCRNSSCSRQIQWKSKPIPLEILSVYVSFCPSCLLLLLLLLLLLNPLHASIIIIRLECMFIYLNTLYVYVV